MATLIWGTNPFALHMRSASNLPVGNVFQDFCRAIISVTSDYGVEHQIGNVAFDGRKLFNHWGGRMLVDNWDAECDVDTNTTVSFERALKVPGTEHVCNNALNQCLERTQGYKPWHRRSNHVARFLRKPL